MKDQILLNLDNPGQLEKLYRTDKPTFKRAFKALYPDLQGNVLASFWNERLNFASEEISWGSSKELTFVVVASLIAGLIAKIPTMFHINEDFFYPRNIGFVVFPALMAFFVWKNEMHKRNIIVLAGATLAGLVYINLLPDVDTSDTLVLACIHLALFLWSLLGFAFVGDRSNVGEKQLGFLKYNGDLVVMTGLILISGGILTAITINLFLLIGIKIDEFYFQNIGVFGLAAAPIVGTYLTQTNPQLVGKVSPVIAKIFSPLVLVMLLVYLVAMIYSGKDPYNDREFLLIFNALLVGVMAIIFFSVAETAKTSRSQAEVWVIFLLSIVTIAVNGIALSAILFRISEWGITPNRAAVLGSNVLILINLLLVTIQIYKVMTRKKDIIEVGKTIGSYLPVYFIWTIIVTFVFPLIFGFK
ncbi:hypothetical protein [Dyadobacter fanqingshengii]|uniref:DUF4153 domain-containing protein n=1 Tax=Dyadobacter fanqingshengii TaxID=2906443 RepID=A0A9X1PBS6_9BACT|nr:hypothetical protein [Dyadobacter fanqingshengii]MCF0041309.1 hypothetical protein [Dyadobacter fanqingshengii]USJ36968.1 hypothetical protein NFI81_04155 [Dyadobacter fanqingshengii]